MKKKSLQEKIRALFSGMKKGDTPSTSFAKRFSTSRSYKSSQFETGARKKSFLERWKEKKAEKVQPQTTFGRTVEVRKRPLLKAVIVVTLLLGGVYLLVMGPVRTLYTDIQYFRIHEIEFNGCVTTSPTTLRQFAGISYEMNMLSIAPSAMKKRLEEHPWVAEATIRRIWPDVLHVLISEYRPEALIVQEGRDGFEYLDRKGIIFAEVTPGQEIDFPVITGLGGFETKSERKKLLDDATSFLKLAARNNPNLPAQNISEMHFDDKGELILYLVEHPFPIYFGKGEIEKKYYQLRKVLEILYRKKKGVSMIDSVVYIRMDYQKGKVLVAKNQAGKA